MTNETYEKYGFGTNAVHAGREPETLTGAVVPNITLSTTFKMKSPSSLQSYVYSRSNNPTRERFENAIAALEKGKYGIAFSSGSAVLSSLVYTLDKGSHIICCDDVYGGTHRFLAQVASQYGFEVTFMDLNNLELLKSSIKKNTKMIWIESPTNPLLKVIDIASVATLIRSVSPEIIIVTDNTFMSPYFQNPLTLGSHIVVHSVTKYLNGHGDVIMGIAVTNCPILDTKIRFLQNTLGSIPSPFDCFLALRGVQSLHLRMERSAANAMEVAKFLEALVPNRVSRVFYPGLQSYSQYEVAKKQQLGFGSMLSFYINGDMELATKFLMSLKLFILAESLGSVESLAELPALMTHASVNAQHRQALGITDYLIRLSIGIESAKDLIEDLDQAFKLAFNEGSLL